MNKQLALKSHAQLYQTIAVIKDGIWQSKEEIIKHIMHYIKQYNEHRARLFKWTYRGKVWSPNMQ